MNFTCRKFIIIKIFNISLRIQDGMLNSYIFLFYKIINMNETELLIEKIVEGIQEKKGKRINIINMTNLEAICRYFVICEGTSNTQILAIADNVKEYVNKNANAKPLATDGLRNSIWVAMDYGDVMVHIFENEARSFYNLENLWNDAKLTEVPDLE